MFVAHGHAFLMFLLCAFVSCIATGRRGARLLRLRALYLSTSGAPSALERLMLDPHVRLATRALAGTAR